MDKPDEGAAAGCHVDGSARRLRGCVMRNRQRHQSPSFERARHAATLQTHFGLRRVLDGCRSRRTLSTGTHGPQRSPARNRIPERRSGHRQLGRGRGAKLCHRTRTAIPGQCERKILARWHIVSVRAFRDSVVDRRHSGARISQSIHQIPFLWSGDVGKSVARQLEGARQVSEASDLIVEDEPQQDEGVRIYRELLGEFGREVELLGGGDNAELRLESAYTRSMAIAGKPLTDGYHFGQTITNDFGRPEEQGFNNVSGLSGWTADGPFAVYVRSEFQYSPSAPALPVTAREAISQADFGPLLGTPPPGGFPVPPDTPTSTTDRGRLLDTYVAMNISDWQLSYGKQS